MNENGGRAPIKNDGGRDAAADKRPEDRPLSALVITLGCKANQYDGDALMKSLQDEGFSPYDGGAWREGDQENREEREPREVWEERENREEREQRGERWNRGEREPPDFVAVNTCAVTAESERKSRQLVRRARKRYPGAIIAFVGCYAERAAKDGGVPDLGADIVAGVREAGRVAAEAAVLARQARGLARENRGARAESHIARAPAEGSSLSGSATGELPSTAASPSHSAAYTASPVASAAPSSVAPAFAPPRAGAQPRTRALLKVQDGCDSRCAYCVVPLARGPSRSAPQAQILREARDLAEGGAREIVITGIHISSYGKDFAKAGVGDAGAGACRDFALNGSLLQEERFGRNPLFQQEESHASGERLGLNGSFRQEERFGQSALFLQDRPLASGERLGLGALIESIADAVGTYGTRLRLSSLEPGDVTAEFVRSLSRVGSEIICPHFHLSLQSGSADVLARMRRRYTPRMFVEAASALRDAFPGAALTTDVIVGFPGETQREFEQTLAFCEKAAFAKIHIFRFSPRPGAPAKDFSDQIAPSVKAERAERLAELAEALSLSFNRSFVGKITTVLVETVSSRRDSSSNSPYATGTTPHYQKAYVKVSAAAPVSAPSERATAAAASASAFIPAPPERAARISPPPSATPASPSFPSEPANARLAPQPGREYRVLVTCAAADSISGEFAAEPVI